MRKGKKRARTGFGIFLGAMLLFAIFFYIDFTTIQVSGTSMYPTFRSGQRLLVSKAYFLFGAVKDRDIVVVKDPGGPGNIIKRVYRMGGESVDPENWPDGVPMDIAHPYLVPDGTLYLLGDNKPVSEDSRKFGPVPMDKLVGKVIVYR